MALNTTASAGLAAEVAEFYDKTLLHRLIPELHFMKYGQKRPIPKNAGKTIEFRRFSSLPTNIAELTEGVAPAGQSLEVTKITAGLKQLGDIVKVTDLVDLTAKDPVITEATELCGEQAGQVIEQKTIAVLTAGTNEYNAGGQADIDEITEADILKADDILKLRTIYKRNNVKPVSGGHYLMFVDPEQIADLMRDPLWRDAAVYSAHEKLEDGEIGRLYGFKFIDTNMIEVADNAEDIPIHTGIAIGKGAYGITDIEGSSKPERYIVKGADKSDPLNQVKAIVGWKAYFGAVILEQLALIRVQSAATEI